MINRILTVGLPQHATLAPAAYYGGPSSVEGQGSVGSPHSPTAPSGGGAGGGQENGHDNTFSDFVTLVCQEAQSTQGGGGATIQGGVRYAAVHSTNIRAKSVIKNAFFVVFSS